MKKLTLAAITLASTLAATTVALPAKSQPTPPAVPGSSYIGPSVSFGDGNTYLGIESKFPISSNISLRPAVRFPSAGVSIGAAATYDFTLSNDFRLIPFAGIGATVYTGTNNNNGTNVVASLVGGADYLLTEQFALNGTVNIPLNSNNANPTNVAVGIAYRF
jgi:hypothetical protein